MILHSNFQLQGEYTVNVYNKNGTLKQSIGPRKNFITPTGLSMIAKFAIADCFRYLSLGSGTVENGISPVEYRTVDLSLPLSQFSFIGGRTVHADAEHVNSQYVSASFTESNNVLTLSRGWRVPTGTDSFTGNYVFKEFKLSPGRPPRTGTIAEEGGTYSLCYCGESALDSVTADYVYGTDFSAVADEYRNRNTPICAQTGAFVRVVTDIPVSIGDSLVLNYDLKITVDSGVNYFSFTTSNSKSEPSDLKNWQKVTGCSALLHHGLKLINPGSFKTNTPWGYVMDQPSSAYVDGYEFGESFVSSWGDPLEPYLQGGYLGSYISTDWLQFAANKVSGGHASTYSNRSGLMYWRSNPYLDASEEFPLRYFNIRQPNGTYSSLNETPNPADVSEDSITPIADYGHEIFFGPSTQATAVSIDVPANVSGRSRSVTRSFQYNGLADGLVTMIRQPIRNMVLSYLSQNASTFQNNSDYVNYHIPYFDVAFMGTGGFITPPNLSARILTTGYKGDYSVGNPGQFRWNYIEDDSIAGISAGKLTFTFKETWSSPCDASVIGCPEHPEI